MNNTPKVLRIVFTPDQTAAILESGIRAAVGFFDDTPPGNGDGKPARAALSLFDCSPATATAAGNVLLGTHTATPARPPGESPAEP